MKRRYFRRETFKEWMEESSDTPYEMYKLLLFPFIMHILLFIVYLSERKFIEVKDK
jgi:hypothetical protein